MKLCEYCGINEVKTKQNRFCSFNCYAKSRVGKKFRKVNIKLCLYCKKEFDVGNKQRKYCSAYCSQKGSVGHPKYFSKEYLGDKFNEIEKVRCEKIGKASKERNAADRLHTKEVKRKIRKTIKERYPNMEPCHTKEAEEKRSKSLKKFRANHPEANERSRQIFIERVIKAGKHHDGLPEDFVLLDKSKKQISVTLKKTYRERPELIEGIKRNRLKQILPVKDTSIEIKVQKALNKKHVSYTTHYPFHGEIATQIDVAIPEKKIAIYCDGDYWHNLPNYIIRDNRANEVLLKNGWRVLRFWEHEINGDIDNCVDKVLKEINNG